ncbi:MAG: helix-turn-helix domain-containing GNAT family N-acetyltransferase [Eubacteriales bacterium]|nr:helix-turn-helix domain-containing GNAT family N-acetyltransferase [Eubacteriales bacterium]
MNLKLATEVALIRSFNRFYTNILGLIDQHILKSEFSLSEVRVLHEIEKTPDCTSKVLSDILSMDAGYLSRIIRKFEKTGFIKREQSESDGRAYNLYITEAGRKRMTELNRASSKQIAEFLKPLPETDRSFLVRNMTEIETILTEGKSIKPEDITIRTDIHAGDIGYITYMHGWIYRDEYGYSTAFEQYVADSFVEFLEHFDADRDCLWCAEHHGTIVGSIGIVGHGDRAQLRWFLVDPHYRDMGLGKKLLEQVIAFAGKKSYGSIYLDTASDLDKAIYLYEQAGFHKMKEKPNDAWRKGLMELEMEMNLTTEEPNHDKK